MPTLDNILSGMYGGSNMLNPSNTQPITNPNAPRLPTEMKVDANGVPIPSQTIIGSGGNVGYNTPAFQNAQQNNFQTPLQGQQGVYNPPKGLFNITPTPQNTPGFNTLAPQYQSWLQSQQPQQQTPVTNTGTGPNNPNTGVVGPLHTGGGNGTGSFSSNGNYLSNGAGYGSPGTLTTGSGTTNSGLNNGTGSSSGNDSGSNSSDYQSGSDNNWDGTSTGTDNSANGGSSNFDFANNNWTADMSTTGDWAKAILSGASAIVNPGLGSLLGAANNGKKLYDKYNTQTQTPAETNRLLEAEAAAKAREDANNASNTDYVDDGGRYEQTPSQPDTGSNSNQDDSGGGAGGGGFSGGFDLGQVEEMSTGGLVKGPGTGTSDSIPTKLSKGEFVIPAAIVKALGRDYFEKMIKAQHR